VKLACTVGPPTLMALGLAVKVSAEATVLMTERMNPPVSKLRRKNDIHIIEPPSGPFSAMIGKHCVWLTEAEAMPLF
jgi:hypothetical protein